MLGITLNRRTKSDKVSIQSKGTVFKAVLFVGFILVLVAWAFWGDDLERKIYGTEPQPGKLGAQIQLSYGRAGGPSHLVIGHVQPNSPAQRSGLKKGDQILGIDGQIISSSEMAAHILQNKQTGDTIKMTVLRDNKSRHIYVHLSAKELRDKVLKIKSLSTGMRVIVMIIFLKLTILLFLFLWRDIENRTWGVLFFAFASLMTGALFRIYTPVDALFAIKFNTISLLLGMYIISIILDQAGFFDYIAFMIYRFAGDDKTKILILFCMITYLFSLLVNNLTTILVIVPMTLNLAAKVRFDPRPVIIGEIISSNLGGASTMVGDFPNMLISSETGIGFNHFIIFMMPICMILFAILLIYLKVKFHDLGDIGGKSLKAQKIIRPKLTQKDRRITRRALFILFHMIFLFSISKSLSLSPSVIALVGGLSLFLFSGMNKILFFEHLNLNDILFFTGLFVIVGGIEASGLLGVITKMIMGLSFGKPWLCSLLLMWLAAVFTAFLSAGPTTALFFPIVLGIGSLPPHHIIWWSLSLGVLAGSCATVIGATAGPVAISLVENFSIRYNFDLKDNNTLTFKQFSRTGVPIMIIFLIISSLYILLLNVAY